MNILATNIELIDLPSEPAERGRVHGEALRENISRNFLAQAEVILSSPASRKRGLSTLQDYLDFAERYAQPIRLYSPDLYREIEGIAEAANLSVRHIIAMNAHLEMIDVANRAAPDPLPDQGCTAFGVSRPEGRGCLLWQTYDLNDYYEDAAVAFRTSTDGVTMALLSFAGTLAAAGMNSSGTGIVINKLYGADARPGVPFCVVLRAALEQKTPGRSLSMILGAERASSINYLVGDDAGILYPLETSAREWDLLDPDADTFVHANHFLSPLLKPLERRDFRTFNAHTIVRFMRGRQALKRLGTEADNASYQATMEDQHNFPLSINCHDADGIKVKTVASVFFDLAAREARFARGNPSVASASSSGQEEVAVPAR